MKKEKKISKAAFIRSCPTTDTAAEVVAKGAKIGLEFSPQVVHATRSAARLKTKTSGRAAILDTYKPRANPAALLVATQKPVNPVDGSDESDFVQLVGSLGLSKSRQLLTQVETRLQGL